MVVKIRLILLNHSIGHRVGRVLSIFSSRHNLDSPNPSPVGECVPPFWGRGTLAGDRGWESPNSDEGTYTVVLFMYMYFEVSDRFIRTFLMFYISLVVH
jgi:hypothetical protein